MNKKLELNKMPILRLTVIDKSIPLKEVSNEIYNDQWIKYISFENDEILKNLYNGFKEDLEIDPTGWVDVNFPFIEKLSNEDKTYEFMSKLLTLLEQQDITNIRLNSICEINPNDWKLKRLYNLEYLTKDVEFFFTTKSSRILIKEKRTL